MLQFAYENLGDALIFHAAAGLLEQIADAMAVAAPPLAISRAVPNAQADHIGITANPDWLDANLAAVSPDPGFLRAGLIGVLAHELGHLVGGDAWAPWWVKRFIELRADWFAGVACARLGVSAEAFAVVIWRVAEHHGSRDPSRYPNRRDRVAAIREGYRWQLRQNFIAAQYGAGQLTALRRFGLAA